MGNFGAYCTPWNYGLIKNPCNFRAAIIAFTVICFFKPTLQVVYKAAVVEYAPKREFYYLPRHILLENTKQYINLIERAAAMDADIIVLPENGLTTSEVNQKVSHHLESYGVEFPPTGLDKNPCDNTSHMFHKVFVDLSCAAKKGKIYVVVNLVEKETINEEDDIFKMHSTNYVFDKNGTIIKEYRKINFHNDLSFNQSTQEMKTFTTDFNVTFGLLIGADILYKKPAIEILKDSEVTDVIYTTTWCSEIPFLSGLSIQHGYAKANRVNLLAASLNDPSYNSSGSGIFLADGSIVDAFVSSSNETKMLIQTISTSDIRPTRGGNCKMSDETPHQRKTESFHPNVGSIKTAIENMQNYSFQPLDFSNKEVIYGCSEVNSFCCYNISIDPASTSQSNYIYRLASFVGARYFGSGSRATTIGVIVCALVACLNENSTSCGIRSDSVPKLIFNSILINVSIPDSQRKFFQPTTLKYDFFPVTDYLYCVQDNKSFIKTKSSQTSLLSFGIFGRIYEYDNKIAGSTNYNDVKQKKNWKNSNSEDLESEAKISIIVVVIIVVVVIILIVGVSLIVFYIVKTKRTKPPNSHLELQEISGLTDAGLSQAPSSSLNFLSPTYEKMLEIKEIVSSTSQDTNQPDAHLEHRTENCPTGYTTLKQF